MRARSTLRILPRIGRIACVFWSRPCLAGPPAESPSTMNSSHSSGLVDWQSASLPGRLPPPSRPLRLRAASRALRAASRANAGALRLAGDLLALARVLLEPLAEPVVDDLLHERLRLGVAELGLGLALELRLGQLDADDRDQALADVVAGEVGVLLLEDAPVARELVDQRGQRGPEALFVRAALVGVDRVGERVHRLGEAGVPLHRDVERHAAVDVLGLGLERHDGAVHGVLARAEVVDVVDEAAVVAVDDLGLRRLLDLVGVALLGRGRPLVASARS